MNFNDQITAVQEHTLAGLLKFQPELALCGTIVVLLLLRIMFGRRISAALLALVGSAIGFGLAVHDSYTVCCVAESVTRTEIFGGMLVYDGLTTYFRTFLLAFTVLFVLVTWRTGIPDREDGPDFYTLAMGSVLGMCLMASANHLLMIFLAIEMASVPSYCLAGMLKGRKESSEAALKFAVYGAGAAGIMLYGISLIAGVVGTVHLPSMAGQLADALVRGTAESMFNGTNWVLALAGLMIAVGLAFKLSAVPFHFWAPDVFEGAAAEIGGFLSVASKGAAVALLIRIAIGFGYEAPQQEASVAKPPPPKAAAVQPTKVHTVAARLADEKGATADRGGIIVSPRDVALDSVRNYIAGLIAFLAAITATFGNLAAYGQTNIKRLLAYSTIAHAGYMMMPVAAVVVLAGGNTAQAADAVATVAFYVAMYLFMNLGAFTIVAFLRNQLRSEEIDDYAGLIHRCPGLVVCFTVILFSLIGLPPMAGLVAKVVIFYSVVNAGMYLLVTVGVLNSVLSLFYYLRVIKVMIFADAPAEGPAVRLPLLSLNGLYVLALSLPVLVFGIYWDPVFQWAKDAAAGLFAG